MSMNIKDKLEELKMTKYAPFIMEEAIIKANLKEFFDLLDKRIDELEVRITKIEKRR